MANPDGEDVVSFPEGEQLRLAEFRVSGLLGGDPIEIAFPKAQEGKSQASILILQGRNGAGKTTILRMIDGLLKLDFNTFRRIPFGEAELVLSNDNVLKVSWRPSAPLPIWVEFEGRSAGLAVNRDSHEYSEDEQEKIDALRAAALPVLGGIQFELLGLERSQNNRDLKIRDPQLRALVEREVREAITLSSRVKRFIRDAQLNHRQFFRTEELTVLPNLLQRLKESRSPASQEELSSRIAAIQVKTPRMKRFELALDEQDLAVIAQVLAPDETLTNQQLALVETYVEMQELAQQSRDLLAQRLLGFESIMDEFLLGKSVRVDSRHGLQITAGSKLITETQLSSGEYHFLYMMVSALLCQRVGSIIAIDEPELSLHVKWQRKLLAALSKCAAGASPLFICATHSLAISAEHADRVHVLSAVD